MHDVERTPLPVEDGGSFSPIAIVRRLDGIEREIRTLTKAIEEAEKNDERFKKMEHNFSIAMWLGGIAIAAAMVAVVNGIASHMSLRIVDAQSTSSTAERIAPDRVSKPITP